MGLALQGQVLHLAFGEVQRGIAVVPGVLDSI